MLYAEEDAPKLKTWVVKRLEARSDADPDVLADYVLALLRHDGDEDSVRELCLQEIPDFLKTEDGSTTDDSIAFVQDIFDAIHYKAYLPGCSIPKKPKNEPVAPKFGAAGNNGSLPMSSGPLFHPDAPNVPVTGMNTGRKRSYFQQLNLDPTAQMGSDRQVKQPRRGGPAPETPHSFAQSGPAHTTATASTGFFAAPQQHHHPHLQNPPSLPNHPPGVPAYPHPVANQPPPGYPTNSYHLPPNQTHPDRAALMMPPQRERCRSWDTSGFCPRGINCKYEHILLTGPGITGFAASDVYDPKNPMLLTNPNIPDLSPPQISQFMMAGLDLPQLSDNSGHHKKKKGSKFKRHRAPFSAKGEVHDRNHTTLVVEEIPEENFDDPSIREFFCQFGEIIQLDLYTRPKRIALVTFDTHEEAHAAWKSPKVIFDNRFVRVFWYQDADPQRLPNPELATSEPHNISKPEDDSFPQNGIADEVDLSEFLQKQEEAQKVFDERNKRKQELAEQREGIYRRQREIDSEKHQLLEECASKGITLDSPDDADDDDSDDEDEITITTGHGSSQSNFLPTNKESLKARLAELESEARMLGIDPDDDTDSIAGFPPFFRGGYRGRGRGRGLGSFRGRASTSSSFRGGYLGRGGTVVGSIHEAYAQYSLDNRPRKVAVSGVDFTDRKANEGLRHYLLGVGEFSDVQVNADNAAVVTFKDRRTAEKFFQAVEVIGHVPGVEGDVDLAWVGNSTPASSAAGASAGTTPAPPGVYNGGAATMASATTSTKAIAPATTKTKNKTKNKFKSKSNKGKGKGSSSKQGNKSGGPVEVDALMEGLIKQEYDTVDGKRIKRERSVAMADVKPVDYDIADE